VWWGILLLAGLLAAGIVALRRQTLAEARPAAAPRPTVEEQLATLRELHDLGALGDAEYEHAKQLVVT
jgi:hypothetical protein